MEESPPFHSLDDFTATSTLITFDPPLPLLRGPLRADFHDKASLGPFVLAFRDFRAWQSGYKSCHSKIIRQCEEGARFGCAISASNKCKSPWWWGASIGRTRGFDLTERARCEELEMDACLAAAKDKCVGFADEKCLKPFRDARIAIGERKTMEKKARKWVHWASMSNSGFLHNMIELDRNSSQTAFGFSHFRAAELWTSDKGLKNLLSEVSGLVLEDWNSFSSDWSFHGNVHDQNWLLYDKVTVLESEKRAWESSSEAQMIKEALNPWKNQDSDASKTT